MPELKIPTQDNDSFGSYICFPKEVEEGGTAPCVVMIQEIFGINKVMRNKCNWLANHGFIACAPDLFHQFEDGVELSDQNEDDLARAFDLFGQFNIDQGIKDIQTTLHTLRGHANSNGKVGAVGYCLGGKLSFLTACQSDVNASVGYYGVGIEGLLAQANNIKSPLLLHVAEDDEFVPPEAQEIIRKGLQENNNVALHSYAGVSHAFAREGGDNYNDESAALANNRTIKFLNTHLK